MGQVLTKDRKKASAEEGNGNGKKSEREAGPGPGSTERIRVLLQLLSLPKFVSKEDQMAIGFRNN